MRIDGSDTEYFVWLEQVVDDLYGYGEVRRIILIISFYTA